jgi:hypothetical protein
MEWDLCAMSGCDQRCLETNCPAAFRSKSWPSESGSKQLSMAVFPGNFTILYQGSLYLC